MNITFTTCVIEFFVILFIKQQVINVIFFYKEGTLNSNVTMIVYRLGEKHDHMKVFESNQRNLIFVSILNNFVNKKWFSLVFVGHNPYLDSV